MRAFLLFTLFFSTACVAGIDENATTSDTDELSTDRRPDLIECRADRECPRGSYCEVGLNACFTSQRCIVEGRPSDEFCERTFGRGFVCFEYAADSYHCMPTE